MEAVILAGGRIPDALAGATDATERALILVDERPILHYVVDSLQGVERVTGIVCVSTPRALESLPAGVRGVAAGEKLSKNLLAGAREAKSDSILIVTGDGPLATARTWNLFLDGAQQNQLDAAYSVVREDVMEREFPGARRTYARFRDGSFSGGNAFIVPRARLDALESLVETAFAARKNPLGLARLLGARFIVRALSKQLRVGEAEAKVSALLGCRAGRVEVDDASIAFDVDKPEDLKVAQERLKSRS